MKKTLIKFLLFAITAIMFAACGEGTETISPDNHFDVNGKSYTLTTGVVDDNGTDDYITYREYNITLASSDSENPKNSISFYLFSTSTTKIADGTYSLGYYSAGKFSYPTIQFNIAYDQTNTRISGSVLTSSDIDYDYDNTITVSTKGDDKIYNFDLQYIKDSVTYKIQGSYEGALQAGWGYILK